eukprot:641702_1
MMRNKEHHVERFAFIGHDMDLFIGTNSDSRAIYINTSGKCSLCNNGGLPLSDHPLTDTCGICIYSKIKSFEACVNSNNTENAVATNVTDTEQSFASEPNQLIMNQPKVQNKDRSIILTHFKNLNMFDLMEQTRFLKYEQFVAQIYHTNRSLYIYNMAVFLSYYRIVCAQSISTADQDVLCDLINNITASVYQNTHSLCSLFHQQPDEYTSLLNASQDHPNKFRKAQLFE